MCKNSNPTIIIVYDFRLFYVSFVSYHVRLDKRSKLETIAAVNPIEHKEKTATKLCFIDRKIAASRRTLYGSNGVIFNKKSTVFQDFG
jgi:hypothetical protein